MPGEKKEDPQVKTRNCIRGSNVHDECTLKRRGLGGVHAAKKARYKKNVQKISS